MKIKERFLKETLQEKHYFKFRLGSDKKKQGPSHSKLTKC